MASVADKGTDRERSGQGETITPPLRYRISKNISLLAGYRWGEIKTIRRLSRINMNSAQISATYALRHTPRVLLTLNRHR